MINLQTPASELRQTAKDLGIEFDYNLRTKANKAKLVDTILYVQSQHDAQDDMAERQQHKTVSIGDLTTDETPVSSIEALALIFAKVEFKKEHGMLPDFENATEYQDPEFEGLTGHHFYCDVLIGHTGSCCDIREDLRSYYITANYSNEIESDYWFNWHNAYNNAKSYLKPKAPVQAVKKPAINSFNDIYLLVVPKRSNLRVVGFGNSHRKAA